MIRETLENDGAIITLGNGGSMADAIHWTEELLGKFRHKRRPLRAFVPSDASYLTCVANDFGFDNVFSRYVIGVARKGDLVIALSTSGFSENVIKAAIAAQSVGAKVISITQGLQHTPLWTPSDLVIGIKTDDSALIQETTMSIFHTYCEWLDKEYGGKP